MSEPLSFETMLARIATLIDRPDLTTRADRNSTIASLELDSIEVLGVLLTIESELPGFDLPLADVRVGEFTLGELHHIYAAQLDRQNDAR